MEVETKPKTKDQGNKTRKSSMTLKAPDDKFVSPYQLSEKYAARR